jgi:hypothetical protein
MSIFPEVYMVCEWSTAGVFNLSDSAGHINNFNDARGPQSYTAAFRIVSCFPDTQRTTAIHDVQCTCTHNWEKWPERQSDHKLLYNVQTTSRASVCSYFFKMAGGPRQRASRATRWRPLIYRVREKSLYTDQYSTIIWFESLKYALVTCPYHHMRWIMFQLLREIETLLWPKHHISVVACLYPFQERTLVFPNPAVSIFVAEPY